MPEIKAPITGSVLQIHAAVGDVVEEGTVVATIESMKLEIPVEAGVSGTIDGVRIEAGAAVAEDDVLFTVT
jgi:acetyl-CoA carboxylase biotin carboxyl carrier protein